MTEQRFQLLPNRVENVHVQDDVQRVRHHQPAATAKDTGVQEHRREQPVVLAVEQHQRRVIRAPLVKLSIQRRRQRPQHENQDVQGDQGIGHGRRNARHLHGDPAWRRLARCGWRRHTRRRSLQRVTALAGGWL